MEGCVMSYWLFNMFMDGIVTRMKARVDNVRVKVSTHDTEQV